MSKKVQQAVFLMLKEATLLRTGMAFRTDSRHRSHVNFISDILNTKQNLGVARPVVPVLGASFCQADSGRSHPPSGFAHDEL